MNSRLCSAALGFALLATAPALAAASPCDGVDRSLAAADKTGLNSVVAKQLDAPDAEVLKSFRLGAWRILDVDPRKADEAFLFYAQDPRRQHYVTLWGGAATESEEAEVRAWAIANAPHIPAKLAACFAWHVTKNRGR